VISSTGAPHPIFRREHGQAFMQRRRNRPMFFIDIAVPRDVDPEMGKLKAFLFTTSTTCRRWPPRTWLSAAA
jgi:glutamyl-tRNA reductase